MKVLKTIGKVILAPFYPFRLAWRMTRFLKGVNVIAVRHGNGESHDVEGSGFVFRVFASLIIGVIMYLLVALAICWIAMQIPGLSEKVDSLMGTPAANVQQAQ